MDTRKLAPFALALPLSLMMVAPASAANTAAEKVTYQATSVRSTSRGPAARCG